MKKDSRLDSEGAVMAENVFHILKERGFIYQTTDDEAIEKLLGTKKVTCYIGFDATADSLHVGSLVPIVSLVHMQRCGHRPIALLGGGTTMVGDPSGKTEMRQVLAKDQIDLYGSRIKAQFAKYISFENGKALLLNNADWLLSLNYIEFLRDVGRHFSVNKMLTADSVKLRLEKGLSFIEFNYMLLQAYDFYVQARDYDCELQMGGQDQWGNIVSGVDLTRRMMDRQVYGMTFPLLLNSTGEKFGKTAAGAVWLDAAKTSPFDFYQFWRNVEDEETEKCLGLFTFLPMSEAASLVRKNINRAKEILAYEVTKLTHGKEEAVRSYTASVRQFGSSDPKKELPTTSDIVQIDTEHSADLPTIEFSIQLLEKGISVVKLFVDSGLCGTNSEARRLIQQGGAAVNEVQVKDDHWQVKAADLMSGALLLRAGKKRFKRIVFT